jgi:hypothetical protein
MNSTINQERVNDTAKRMMHRLIARQLGRDPSLVERARDSLCRSAERYGDYAFVQDWKEFLDLPASEMRRLLTCRNEEMTRLRLSSPFVLAEGIDFGNEALRRRIWRAARRVAARSVIVEDRSNHLRIMA